jgi:hypothetical protein
MVLFQANEDELAIAGMGVAREVRDRECRHGVKGM